MTRPIPILLYHGVDHDPAPGLAPFVMDPARFAEHVAIIAERGCPTFTVSELVDLLRRGEEPPPGSVAVTFDDGLADFAVHAWPAMRSHEIAGTLYVATGEVGGRARWLAPLGDAPPMLTWDQVAELDADGCEIGAHSQTHPQLDTLRSAALTEEVRGSRVDLGLHLGHPARSFAYPHGFHSPRVVEAVRLAGFDSACAVRNLLSSPDDDPFALARVTVDASWDGDRLRRVLDGEGLGVAPRSERLRTIGWRTYRRARTLLGVGS